MLLDAAAVRRAATGSDEVGELIKNAAEDGDQVYVSVLAVLAAPAEEPTDLDRLSILLRNRAVVVLPPPGTVAGVLDVLRTRHAHTLGPADAHTVRLLTHNRAKLDNPTLITTSDSYVVESIPDDTLVINIDATPPEDW